MRAAANRSGPSSAHIRVFQRTGSEATLSHARLSGCRSVGAIFTRTNGLHHYTKADADSSLFLLLPTISIVHVYIPHPCVRTSTPDCRPNAEALPVLSLSLAPSLAAPSPSNGTARERQARSAQLWKQDIGNGRADAKKGEME